MTRDRNDVDVRLRAAAAREGRLLARAIILPLDLYGDVERVAQANGFQSVQTFVVVTLQALVNARPETQDPHTYVTSKS